MLKAIQWNAMLRLNLDHLQDSQRSSHIAGLDARWAHIGAVLFFVAAGISVASTVWTGDYKGLGGAIVRLSLMAYFAYRAVRGFLGTGIATCIAGLLVLGVVAFTFIPNGIVRYQKERELERLKPIAMRYKTELTEMGRELANTLEKCQVDDAYSLFGGRDEITPPKLLDLRVRVETALKSLKECQSQSQPRIQAEKREALATGDTESVRAFVSGVDRGLIALTRAFQIHQEFYGQMRSAIEFLTDRQGGYHRDGQRLIFAKQSDSKDFDKQLTALYQARKVLWQFQAEYQNGLK